MDDAMPEGLVRSDPSGPGFSRRRRGRGFGYVDASGATLTDPEHLARAKGLVIPPAWQDVWISPDPAGHIQAVGTDAAGRRQYRYHDVWNQARAAVKYDRVLTLGKRMPTVREEIAVRLSRTGLDRDRVLAGAVRMLDVGVFRAGGEEYAPGEDDDEEGTFGLATLRRDHVRLRRGAVEVRYLAKGGIERTVALRDPLLHRFVGGLLRRRGGGEDLLAHRVGRGWHDVRAEDLNAGVKELVGGVYTCKDLRTWNATVLAAATLAAAAPDGPPTAERTRKRLLKAAVTEVAEHLGNTPTVARASYVDPRVIQRFEEGVTIASALRRAGAPAPSDDAGRAVLERAVVRLIED
ncbi:DNA topoisomerase IB [Pseudonocardia oceani]|nr:DNA topoisomerase IB [Pseudonocardia oceani]